MIYGSAMSTPEGRSTARVALVGVGVLALLGIVAAATRGGFGHTTAARTSADYRSWAMSAFLVVVVAAAPFALYVFVTQQRNALAGKPRKSFARRVVESLLVCAAVVALLAFRHQIAASVFGRPHVPPHARPVAAAVPHIAPGRHARHASQPHFEWPVLWVALALGAAVVGVVVARRPHRDPVPLEPSVEDELAADLGDAIDDLEAEPDPRRAVVAAYARMEGSLARHGLRRLPSQTPLEYLRRLLAELSGRAEAAARLTALFEEARFSTHSIDATMKREAIDALRAIRAGLAEAS